MRPGAGQASRLEAPPESSTSSTSSRPRARDQRERLARRPLAARVGHGVRGLAQRNPREAPP